MKQLLTKNFVVNPVLSFFSKKMGASEKSYAQLYAYQEMYELLDSSIATLMGQLLKGKKYTEVEIKDLITQSLGSAHTEDLYAFLINEKFIILAKEDPILKYTSDYTNHLVEKIYHESTRIYPFLDMATQESFSIDNQRMGNYLENNDYLDLYKDYKNHIGKIILPSLNVFEDFANVQDNLKDSDVLTRLGMILGFCFGERRDRHLTSGFWDDGKHRLELLFKSVPSGGSRHPTECYLVSDGKYLPSGCYHYSVRKHLLEKITTDTIELDGTFLVITAFVERAMWRYRDPRSWRAIPCEIGHVLKLLSVVSQSMEIEVDEIARGNMENLQNLLRIGEEEPIFSILKVTNNEQN